MPSLFMVTYHVCYWTKKEIITFLESVLMYPWEYRGHSGHGIGIEIRGPPVGVGSLIPPLWGSWRWNSVSRLIWQASLPTDSSGWPHDSYVNKAHSWQDVDLYHIPSFPHYNGFFSELGHLASSGQKIHINYPPPRRAVPMTAHECLPECFSGSSVSIKNPYKETEYFTKNEVVKMASCLLYALIGVKVTVI